MRTVRSIAVILTRFGLAVAVVGLVLGSLVSIRIAFGEEPNLAVSASCAFWLDYAGRAKEDHWFDGYMTGYAAGVISAGNAAIRPTGQTSITSLCASSPQKRLIDVTLHLLGYR